MEHSERRALVERAREGWIRKLIDLSRRNNLLYYRELRAGTLDLSAAPPALVDALFQGESVLLSRLLPAAEELETVSRVREIRRRAIANLEERGIETLFLAVGMATWSPADQGRPPAAAVLLLPLRIEGRGLEGRSFALRRAGELHVNLVLLHVLEHEFGCSVSPEWLLEEREADEQSFDVESVFSRLLEQGRRIPGFAIEPRVVVGNFSFQKLAMVKDLRERAADLEQHDLIAAIAGDAAARARVTAPRAPIDPAGFDAQPPDEEFLVLDADSSQQQVVAAVSQGQDGVIHGPPGTGKSQTIANIITTLAAQGQRVLFVAEKRAALEVVLRRLQTAGLGHLALDLHTADISRREVARRFAENLALIREAPPAGADELHRRFVERRWRLVAHADAMHRPLARSGVSLYQVQGRLLELSATVVSKTRWRGEAVASLTSETLARVRDLLVEAAGLVGLLLGGDPSPWAGASFGSSADVQRAVELAEQLPAHLQWARQGTARLARRLGIPQPATLNQSSALSAMLTGVNDTLALYRPELFEHDLTQLERDLSQPGEGGMSRMLAWLFRPAYRRALALARSLRAGGPAPATQLRAEIAVAARLRHDWQGATGTAVPPAQPEAAELATQLGALGRSLGELGQLLGRGDLADLPLAELERLLQALGADQLTPYRALHAREIEREIERRGCGALLAELRATRPDPASWPLLFEHAWLSSLLEHARAELPALASFDGRAHDQAVAEFNALDQQRIQLAGSRVRRRHAERAIEAMNAHPLQATLVRHEAGKRARHLPLRKLLAQAPDVLTALCPCWMASPLSISQLLGAERRYFDVVIFDEASQVLPEDAIAAIVRGERLVVAGDRHQLPPTAFFAAAEQEQEQQEEQEAGAGFQSLLDLMSALLNPWPLTWHYRSRDEALIAFSNRHIYEDRLVTFPGPGGAGAALTHVLVPHTPGLEGQEESAAEEVRRVVALILEHAQSRPGETLGVIAMGIRHAERIETALELALASRPELERFFDQSQDERFFVKNLERVQGDERDAIILSIGYGKDRAGRLPYRFGPLLSDGGERRLNVAITRARQRLTLVSSFSHHDMAPERSKARGVQLLRAYLQYAASGGQLLGGPAQAPPAPGPLESDLAAVLAERGLPLLPQWGASRARIDFVAQHPGRPERLVLALELDGATYRSAPTARDRDRLRRQQLESLGWRYHRIWSTDWFLRREAEVERALAAFYAAVARADRDDQAASALGAPAPASGVTISLQPPSGAAQLASLPATSKTIPLAQLATSLPDLAPDGAAAPAEAASSSAQTGGVLTRPASTDGHASPSQPAATPQSQAIMPGAGGPGQSAARPASTRTPRPQVPRRQRIEEYQKGELVALVRWISSDGQLRTDEEILSEMVKELGFRRRGPRIEEAVRAAIQQYKRVTR